MQSYRAAVISDLHAPFINEDLLDLVLQAIKDANIDILYINGDCLDFYAISSHGPKSPHVITSFEDEVEWGLNFFKKLRELFPTQKIVFNAGNHEYRLDRFIAKNCPSFFNFLRLEQMLQLEHFKIEYVEYNNFSELPNCDLRVQHSPPSYSENLCMTSLKKKMDGCYIWGCSHRLDSAYKTGTKGKIYRCYSGGWLGSIDLMKENEEVFKYARGHSNWQHGFAIVSVHDGFFHVEQIPIEHSKFIVNNFFYSL